MVQCEWKHKVFTSTAYRYSREDWSEAENIKVFGADASVSGVGYNLIIEAKLDAGDLSEGEFRQRLYDVSRLIDHKFLNQDIKEFHNQAVTAERVLIFLKEKMNIPGVLLRVTESQRCSVENTSDGELVLTLFDKINAIHRHWNPKLSEAENRELYGQCSGMHGHEYNIEFSFVSAMDPESGLVGVRDEIADLLRHSVLDPLDGSFLNDHLGNTSGEKIALQLMERVKKCSITQRIYRIVVRETRKNSFNAGATFF